MKFCAKIGYNQLPQTIDLIMEEQLQEILSALVSYRVAHLTKCNCQDRSCAPEDGNLFEQHSSENCSKKNIVSCIRLNNILSSLGRHVILSKESPGDPFVIHEEQIYNLPFRKVKSICELNERLIYGGIKNQVITYSNLILVGSKARRFIKSMAILLDLIEA